MAVMGSAAILLLDPRWLFSAATAPFIDPWVYLRFFLDPGPYLARFGATYYAGRLGAILPGIVVHSLVPGLAGRFVLHLGLLAAAVGAHFVVAASLLGRRTAVVSTPLLLWNAYLLFAVGWDYVDGAGLTWLSLCLAFLAVAARGWRVRTALLLAGMAAAAMVWTHVFLAVFVPGLVLFHLTLVGRPRIAHLLPAVGGFAAVTALFAAVYRHLAGTFWFFLPSLALASAPAETARRWRAPLGVWLPTAIWLTFPALALAGSLVWLVRSARARRADRGPLVVQALYAATALGFVVLELRGVAVLQHFFYVSYLLPLALLALGGQLAQPLEGMSGSSYRAVAVLAWVGLAASYVMTSWVGQAAGHAAEAAGALLLAAGLVLFLRARPVPATALVLLGLAVLNFRLGVAIYKSRSARDLASDFTVILKTLATWRSLDPRSEFLVWYDCPDRQCPVHMAVASAHVSGFLGESFPALSARAVPILDGSRIAILSSRPDALAEAREALSRLGWAVQALGERRIQDGSASVRLLVVEVGRRSPLRDLRLDGRLWPSFFVSDRPEDEGQPYAMPSSVVIVQSDCDDPGRWDASRYGSAGGAVREAACLEPGDPCLRYTSGDVRDSLSTPFGGRGSAAVFFSVWIEAPTAVRPFVYLQDDAYRTISGAATLARGEGDWRLVGGWTPVRRRHGFRLVVQLPAGTSVRLDKALIAGAEPLPATAAAPPPAATTRTAVGGPRR